MGGYIGYIYIYMYIYTFFDQCTQRLLGLLKQMNVVTGVMAETGAGRLVG